MCPLELDRFPLLYESYSPETKEVIIEALEAGYFLYEILDIVDSKAKPRNKFAPGETVYCNIQGTNYSTTPDKATIVVTDLDTGAEVKKFITDEVEPGMSFSLILAALGTMPNRNWRLRFALTP